MPTQKITKLRKYTLAIASDVRKALRGGTPKKDLQELLRRIGSNVRSRFPEEVAALRQLIKTQRKGARRKFLSRNRKTRKSQAVASKKHAVSEEAKAKHPAANG